MGKYSDAYAEFTSKYDLDLNIQSEYNGAKQLASMDDFIMDTSPADKARNVYMSTLSSALTSYINKKVKFESGKSYDLSNFKLHDFITEFDKLMNAIRTDEAEKEKTEYTHRQFEGLPMDRVANEAWARVAPRFNKPLHEIWAGQIRKGSLPLEQLQNITNRSTRLLDDMVGPDRSYHSEANKDLADVIMIKNTMEEAINQRSWTSWLIPWNWGPNLRENAYLRELEGKINTYRDNKFPVDNVVPQNYAGNMLEGALGELQNTHAARNQPTQNTQTAVKSEKKQATKNKNKSVKVDKKSAKKQDVPGPVPNKETAEALYKDSNTVKAKFSEIIGDYTNIEQYRSLATLMCTYLVNNFTGKCWDEFNAAKNEEQKQAVLAEHSKEMFVKMYNHVVLGLHFTKSLSERLVMTQKLTDFVMNTYSPVASNSRYAKYGDNYFIQNADPVADCSTLESAGSPEEIKQALTQASYELGKGKMSLPLDKEFKENPSKTSEKVQNINVPTKDKRIDM